MTRDIIFTGLLATVLGLFAIGSAQASSDDRDGSGRVTGAAVQWLPLAALVSQLEAKGYTVLEADREDGRYWEVRMRDANGMTVEAYLEPATGAPLADVADLDD